MRRVGRVVLGSFVSCVMGGALGGEREWLRADASPARAASAVQQQKVHPLARDEDSIPQIYRLGDSPFVCEREPVRILNGIALEKLRFPSPVASGYAENDVVHAEYFRPADGDGLACVIVLHIAGGDFELCRFIAFTLARHGLAALFVKMPYYGERRPPGSRIRMISSDLELGLAAVRQTVLDLRRACDWIEATSELDGRIGVMGISLGAVTGMLATAIEPRISHACSIMGGARLDHVLYESTDPAAQRYRSQWEATGGTRESFARRMAPCDPATYAERLRGRRVLLIAASQDEIIPPAASLALWEAAGRPKIVWYPCGHYGMAAHFFPVLHQALEFFRNWPAD